MRFSNTNTERERERFEVLQGLGFYRVVGVLGFFSGL